MKLANGSRLPLPAQALAEYSPQLNQGYYYPESQGLQLEREYALFGGIYRSQYLIRSIIDKRSSAVARLPAEVWNVTPTTKVKDTTSAYAKLIANPCDYMDNFSFWAWVQTTIDIYGETYLAIQRDAKGFPEKLMPMHPSRVSIKRDAKTGRYTYIFYGGADSTGGLVQFKQEDVVPFRLFNPQGLERGLSRMTSLRNTLFSEDSSRNATSSMWKNSGRPNVVITSEKPVGKVGRQRLADAWNQSHSGTSNAGKALVLEDGVTAAEFQLTAVEMQYIEGRKLGREEVCTAYDVAPPIMHILDHATFSNITAQMRAFYRDTMSGPLEFIQSVMNFYVGGYWQTKNEMKFALEDVLRGDPETRAESAQKMATSGITTPNENRELMGYTRIEDPVADKLYANSAMQALGEPAERVTLTGGISGETPDGVSVTAPPTTPVAALDQGKPTSVPALPPGRSSSSTTSTAPGNAPPKPKHLRAIKGELGRGKTMTEIRSFAKQLTEKYPDELEDILLAVYVAIEEKNRKDN